MPKRDTQQLRGRKEAQLLEYKSDTNVAVELSTLETLLQAHPDLTVIRREIYSDVGIIQQLTNSHWRLIDIDVEQEKDAQELHPTVVISGINTPANTFFTSDLAVGQHDYGLTTYVKVHIEDDERVHAAVEYKKGSPFPPDIHPYDKSLTELHARPIPAYELVTIARSGLEMLVAYTNAPEEERVRIDSRFNGALRKPQVEVGDRPNFDIYIAEALPSLGDLMKRQGTSHTNVDTKAIYALNALHNVIDTMLPSEMPQVPKNRKEPARRRPER